MILDGGLEQDYARTLALAAIESTKVCPAESKNWQNRPQNECDGISSQPD
jgi:hypothetical protein